MLTSRPVLERGRRGRDPVPSGHVYVALQCMPATSVSASLCVRFAYATRALQQLHADRLEDIIFVMASRLSCRLTLCWCPCSHTVASADEALIDMHMQPSAHQYDRMHLLQGPVGVTQAIQAARLEEDISVEEWGMVEGGHDLDEMDIRVRVAAPAMFARLAALSHA